MLSELSEKISASESIQEYEQIVNKLSEYLFKMGLIDKEQKLKEIATLRRNIFSKRESDKDFAIRKAAVVEYCKILQIELDHDKSDMIYTMLLNFHLFCRNLYIIKSHEKCSSGIKNHLTGFEIENEYDLQKLMLAVFSASFSDTRTECVQDSGHHSVRKDIVIDSESTVIELKCTRNGMTERQLSEEIAADMIHYDCRRLYFYIYDKHCIIDNTVSFKQTYENKKIDDKSVRIIIYSHSDI